MIVQTVNLHQFRDAFRDIRPDNFSYDGLGELFEYLEQLSDDIGETIEIDVIALCCDYCELSLDEGIEQYANAVGFEPSGDDMDYDTFIDRLEQFTTVIPVGEHSIIIQAF